MNFKLLFVLTIFAVVSNAFYYSPYYAYSNYYYPSSYNYGYPYYGYALRSYYPSYGYYGYYGYGSNQNKNDINIAQESQGSILTNDHELERRM
uniref:Uncharacterized protein n=1 Tax=Parastrongyloides trichosuri TaxID=131310 RepID=A0A0N4Z607_PARTI